jgi:hypothetical protein
MVHNRQRRQQHCFRLLCRRLMAMLLLLLLLLHLHVCCSGG